MPSRSNKNQETVDTCLICKDKIRFEEERKINDIKIHYALCYFNQGEFKTLFPPGQDDDIFLCQRQLCTRRKMNYKQYVLHEAVAHKATQKLMNKDNREGIRVVMKELYPPVLRK